MILIVIVIISNILNDDKDYYNRFYKTSSLLALAAVTVNTW